MNNVLLLTATIVPKNGTPTLSHADLQQRLDDYMQAMSFYLGEAAGTFDHIVFCENSRADLSKLRTLVDTQGWTESVTFYCNDGDYPAHYDRGYGEFKLIDEAMAKVRGVRAADNRNYDARCDSEVCASKQCPQHRALAADLWRGRMLSALDRATSHSRPRIAA